MTRSWDFVGLIEKNTKRNLKVESYVIIGMLDSGIDMGAPSFNDEGYGPPSAKWKGSCDADLNFIRCNRHSATSSSTPSRGCGWCAEGGRWKRRRKRLVESVQRGEAVAVNNPVSFTSLSTMASATISFWLIIGILQSLR